MVESYHGLEEARRQWLRQKEMMQQMLAILEMGMTAQAV